MPIIIVRNDITKMHVDAIVNAANESLRGGGGVDGAIHRVAGPELTEACRDIGFCKTGDACVTPGFGLPCRYIIHTVGPVWQGGNAREEQLLSSCYRRSLEEAEKKHCETIAFPLISAGIYGFPKTKALEIAMQTISRFLLLEHEMTVYIVVFDQAAWQIGSALFAQIKSYIDDRYVEEHQDSPERSCPMPLPSSPAQKLSPGPSRNKGGLLGCFLPDRARESEGCPQGTLPQSVEEAVRVLDESFAQMLLRKIDEKGLTDAQCYKRANIDRKLFSKIRSDMEYRPSKPTVLAFAVSLELSLEETREMLGKAGYAFSHSSKFDIIVEYFIAHGQYDVFAINEALFAFDQGLLGTQAH